MLSPEKLHFMGPRFSSCFEAPIALLSYCVATSALSWSFPDPVMGDARNEVSHVAVTAQR
jgi:hypothetical protein